MVTRTQQTALNPEAVGLMKQNLEIMGKMLDGTAPASATKMYRKAVGSSGNASLFHGSGSIGEDAKMDRNVINNVVQSKGILDIVPAIATVEDLHRNGFDHRL